VFKKQYPSYFVEYNGVLESNGKEMNGQWAMPAYDNKGWFGFKRSYEESSGSDTD
jgi:hypothetical protein